MPKAPRLGKCNYNSNCLSGTNPILFGVPNTRMFLKYWLPVLVWMAVIFTASSDTHSYEHSSRIIAPLLYWLFPHISANTVDWIVFIARKCAHLTEYSVFACCSGARSAGLRKTIRARGTGAKAGWVLLIVAALRGDR